MKRKLLINFSQPNFNYCETKVEGGISVASFPIDITPKLVEGSKETNLKSCKCKVSIHYKIKDKIVNPSEFETFNITGYVTNLKAKEDCFIIDDIEDWFIDTYYKRLDDDKEIEIKKVEICSEALNEELKILLDKTDFEDKVEEVKSKLEKSLKPATAYTAMPGKTKEPKIKGRKDEAKKA